MTDEFTDTSAPVERRDWERAAGPELPQSGSAELQELQQYRLHARFESATETITRSLQARSFIESDVLDASRDWQHSTLEVDINLTQADDRVGLNALGAGAGQAKNALLELAMHLQPSESLSVSIGSGVRLQVKRQGQQFGSFSYRFVVEHYDGDPGQRTQAVDQFLREGRRQFEKSTKAKDEIVAQLSTDKPTSFSNEVFDMATETDDILAILGSLGVSSNSLGAGGQRSLALVRQNALDELAALPSYVLDKASPAGLDQTGIYYRPDGVILEIVVPTNSQGIYAHLRNVDPEACTVEAGRFQIGAEIRVDAIYQETDYNGRTYADVRPFVETTAAAELLAAFSQAGLTLSQRTVDSIAEVGSITTRYGHAFADLTREVAKLINNPERPLTHVVQANNDLVARVAAIPEPTDPGARALVLLLRGVAERTAVASPSTPELPVTHHHIEMRDGSCKDAEVYIAHAGESAIINDDEGKPLLLRSPYSRPSAMTLRAVVMNGVVIPAGALIAIESDGYALMRLTGYAFDAQTAGEIFGAQEAECRLDAAYAARRWDKSVQR